MGAVLNWFARHLTNADSILERSLLLVSIRKGMTLAVPFLMIGSFALVIISFPVAGYQALLNGALGGGWRTLFQTVFDGTFGILSLVVALFTSHAYAANSNERGRDYVNPMIASVVGLGSLIILTGFGTDRFSISAFGVTGLFAAILASAISVWVFAGISRIRRLHIRFYTDGADTAFNDAVSAFVPALITLILFALIGALLFRLTTYSSGRDLVAGPLIALFAGLGAALGGAVLFLTLVHLFWMMGVHGNNMLEPVAQSLYVPGIAENAARMAQGLQPEHLLTKTFFDTFVFMGGCGSTLCLVLAILIVARKRNLRRHARFSLLPVLFNVNELIVFGLPIIFNPIYLIPFILVPVLLMFIAAGATAAGLVPYTVHATEWTTPILLGGYAATGSLAGSVLQLVNLAVGILCYAPFVIISDMQISIRMIRTVGRLGRALEEEPKKHSAVALLSRHDDIGMMSRVLAADLREAIERGSLSLYYQPQIDADGGVIGVESLLRWRHPEYGFIEPPVIVALAEESGMSARLEQWIMDTALSRIRTMTENGVDGVTMSINASALQLDGDLSGTLAAALAAHGVPAELVKVEITEKDALAGTQRTIEEMHRVRALGVKLAMDDFGMGHTSVVHLKEYRFDTVKIDGSLVTDLLENPACGEIISSIVRLGESLAFSVIAEFVETEAQRNELLRLGCRHYQGYLYSRALSEQELDEYLMLRFRK